MPETTGAAAYQKLEKVGNYINENANKAADRSNRARIAQSKINADERQAAAEGQAANKKYSQENHGVDIKDMDQSKYGDANFTGRTITESARAQAEAVAEKQRSAVDRGDMWEAERQQKQLEKINQTVLRTGEQFKLGIGAYSESVEGSKEGRVLSGIMGGMEKFFDGYANDEITGGVVEKNGEYSVVYRSRVMNEDTEEWEETIIGGEEFMLNRGKPVWQNDRKKEAEDALASVGKTTTTTTDGYYNIKTDEWDGGVEGGEGKQSQALRAHVRTKLASNSYMGDMVDQLNLYNQMGTEEKPMVKGVPENAWRTYTTSERRIVEDKLFDEYKLRYNETYSKTYNSAKANADLARQREKRLADAADNSNGVVQVVEITGKLNTGAEKGVMFKREDGKGNAVIKGFLSNDKEAVLNGLYVVKDGTLVGNVSSEVITTETGKTGETGGGEEDLTSLDPTNTTKSGGDKTSVKTTSSN